MPSAPSQTTLVWLSIHSSYSHASLALPMLHTAARDVTEVAWQCVSAVVTEDPAEVAVRAAEFVPDIIAATVYLFNRAMVLETVRRVKALCPQATVILGGPEFLGENRAFLQREPDVTAVLRGEGETPFRNWLKNWQSPAAWQDIPGLCYRDETGEIYANSGRPRETQVDFLVDVVRDPFFPGSGPFITVETTRGCRSHCAYCTSCGQAPLQRLSLAQVRRLFDAPALREAREFRLLDRTFNADPRHCAALLDFFINRQPPARFHLEFSPELLSPPVREQLAAAPVGRFHLEAGLQSGSAAVRRAIHRGGDPEQAWEGIAWLCQQKNLVVHVDLLAGLPEQSWHDLLADLSRLTTLGPEAIQLEILKILPGTPLAERLDERLVAAPTPPYEVLRTTRLSAVELMSVRRLSRLVDRFYNQSALRPVLHQAVMREGAGFYARLLSFLTTAGALDVPISLPRRFRLFHQFCREEKQLAEQEALERIWLEIGESPAHGIAPTTPWKDRPPADARRQSLAVPGVSKEEEDGPTKRERIWYLRQSQAEYWYVYGRGNRHRPHARYFRGPTVEESR